MVAAAIDQGRLLVTQDYAVELRRLAEKTATELLRLPAELVAQRPAPDRWSIKEIVGHLIDSASNNHQRFVRAQWADDLVCHGYDQDAWVRSQHYNDAPWETLVRLWRDFNHHLAWVMQSIPAEDRVRERHPHNLDRLAFRPVPADEAVTLDYFMRDYVEHLEHHLRQIERQIRASGATA